MSEISAYFNRVNPDLLAMIPPDAGTILEIGCGAGALAEAYRRINPNVRWLGVEKNEAAAVLASNPARANWVLCTDAEVLQDIEFDLRRRVDAPKHIYDSWVFLANGVIDCVILGDVLEHMDDPWRFLKWVRGSARDAQILVCIPNVQHYSIIQGLINGHWRYREEGLLDRTHKRFFTLEGVIQLFEQADFKVDAIMPRGCFAEGHDEFMRIIGGIIPEEHREQFAAQTRAYQYLVRAVPANRVTTPLRIGISIDGTVCTRPRMTEPLAFLRTIPGVEVCSDNPQIIINQRCQLPRDEMIEKTREHLASGHLIIAEWDDDPSYFPAMMASDFASIRCAHAVQVSTMPLAEIVRKWNPNVVVFENQLAELPPPKPFNEGPPRLFFGALNRENDWAVIIEPLNRVLRAHPEVVVRVVHDQKFFDALDTANKDFTPFCSYPEYLEILRSCDIALLPLEPTQFNRCKSDIKFLECAANGVAVLASNTVCPEKYDEAYVQKWGGLAPLMVYLDPIEFEYLLDSYINAPDHRKNMADQAYRYVARKRLLSQHYRRRYGWYLRMLEQREQLTAELLERVPELRSES